MKKYFEILLVRYNDDEVLYTTVKFARTKELAEKWISENISGSKKYTIQEIYYSPTI